MLTALRPLVALQAPHNFFDVLHLIAGRNQHGILRFHHHKTAHANGCQQPMVGVKIAVFRSFGHHIARTHVAAVVALPDLIKGLPRAKVTPAHAQRHNCRQFRVLHNCIVYGIRRGGKKGITVWAREGLIILATIPSRLTGSVNFRSKLLQLLQIHRGSQQEHAAVPRIAALGQHGGGGIRSGLFYKAGSSEPIAP